MLADALASTPVRTVDAAVAVMTVIDHRLPDTDGLKWFNRLYLRVTEEVRRQVQGAGFLDPDFLSRLDVVFANFYFAAVREAHIDPARAPAAWRPLFRARHATGVARIQFALAGMNAHINHDLPQAIVESFRLMGGDPIDGDVRHRDFEAVNDLLERVESQVKGEFSIGLIAHVDAAAGRLDDVVAMWNVRAARQAAWTNADVLWALHGVPALRGAFLEKLDGMTGFAGRGLLVRTGLA